MHNKTKICRGQQNEAEIEKSPESNEISHLSFFNFFWSYSQATAIRRFKEFTHYISDKEDQREQVCSISNNWKRATSGASISSTNHSIVSTHSTSSSFAENVETIILDKVKSQMKENIVSNNSSTKYSSFRMTFFDFKLDSMNDSKLLSYESDLPQILALSNILIIKRSKEYF